MKNGDIKDFMDQLYYGGELVFIYEGTIAARISTDKIDKLDKQNLQNILIDYFC